jgi:lipopolysaccharide export system protein LptA
MKALTLVAGFGIAGIVLAQGGFTYRSPKENPNLIISGKSGWVELDKKFEVTGGVKLESKPDKFILLGDRISGDLVKEKQQTVADHIQVRGTVLFTQQQQNGDVKISGKEADYNLLNADLARAVLRGGVKLDFTGTDAKAGSTDITASSVEATFKRKTAKDEDSLVSANMTGPVSYTGVGSLEKGKSTISAKADRMTYELKEDGAELKLAGNLYFSQKGPSDEESADVSGAQSVILTLNKAKEVVRVRMSSEGIGKIVTKIKKKGGSQV